MNSPDVLNATYVILGATGNTGSIIADTLLLKGKKVRVVGRDAGRLRRFVRKGAEAFTADMTDAATVSSNAKDSMNTTYKAIELSGHFCWAECEVGG